jgi:hypothetical protein
LSVGRSTPKIDGIAGPLTIATTSRLQKAALGRLNVMAPPVLLM